GAAAAEGHHPAHHRLHGQLADEQERARSAQLAGLGQPLGGEHVHRPRHARRAQRRAVRRGNGEAPRASPPDQERRRHRLPAVSRDAGGRHESERRSGAVKSPVLRAMSVIAGAAGLGAVLSAQSLSYTKGQNVAPAYEGWEQAADGTKYFLFGYMNRNWEEEIDVPVGADNGFTPGAADQGQPTHFLPRRNRFVFRVRVPANFGPKDELVWTLTSHGKTEKAYATLRGDYIVDDVVKASETGALGAGTSSPEVRANKPPTLAIQEIKSRTVKVGEAMTIVSEVKDDGTPKPRTLARVAAAQQRAAEQATGAQPAAAQAAAPPPGGLPRAALAPPTRITVGKNLGLHVSWFMYRGPV